MNHNRTNKSTASEKMPVGHHFSRRGRLRRKQQPVCGTGVQHPPQVCQPTHEEEDSPNQSQAFVDSDSDESGTDPDEFGEFISLQLSELRENMQCPICLGIIKRTRTVMGCLHRFCRECIDKSIRLGNNECPACRMHCASRRSMRDDLMFDTLIRSVFGDVDKIEEEELVLHEEERTRNQQIQATIAQISHRQSEALEQANKRGKETASGSRFRIPRNSQNAYSRRKKNQSAGTQVLDENEGENGTEGNISSPARVWPVQTSLRALNIGAKDSDTTTGPATEYIVGSPGASNLNTLNWGCSGARSRTPTGSAKGSKVSHSDKISKLADHLASLAEKEEETPMITALTQGVQMIWTKDNLPPSFNSSSSTEAVLKPPPKVSSWASNKSVLQILKGPEIPQ